MARSASSPAFRHHRARDRPPSPGRPGTRASRRTRHMRRRSPAPVRWRAPGSSPACMNGSRSSRAISGQRAQHQVVGGRHRSAAARRCAWPRSAGFPGRSAPRPRRRSRPAATAGRSPGDRTAAPRPPGCRRAGRAGAAVMRSRLRSFWIVPSSRKSMPKVRRMALSSRVSAAKRASEVEDDHEHPAEPRQRRGDFLGQAGRQMRTSSSDVPTSWSGSTPTCAPPARAVRHLVRPRFQDRRWLVGHPRRRGGCCCGRGWRRRRTRRHAAACRAADLRQQLLRLGRWRGVQQIGQHRAAAVVGLDRHAALAARRVGPHQRAPGAFMRPVDLQQTLRRRDRGLGFHLLAQQCLGDRARAVAQPLALGGQPGVEGGIDAVQVLQQVAVEQRQRCRLVGGGAHHLVDVYPDRAGAQATGGRG